MRDLKKNTSPIWYTTPTKTEVMSGSLHTGEYKSTSPPPVKADLSMYPANANVIHELFGTEDTVDMISSSTTLDFSKDTLIFLSEPTGDYAKTYDYSISAISPSLNVKTYGLKKRV